MDRYELRFASGIGAGKKTVSFYAHSTAQALDLARETASGERAEMYLNGRSICRMRLVQDTGVWLIQRTASDDESDTLEPA